LPLFPRSLRLLLIESNLADSYLMVEGLRRAGLSETVTVVHDSTKALTHLSNESPPDLIFLDLNIAPLSGLELLVRIRSDLKLETIPVIIVSGSQNSDDVHRAYRLGANCYVTKPGNLDDFLAYMKMSYEFWGAVATLPR
jgi:chemotaxis family two-component system response regulator Rcp1